MRVAHVNTQSGTYTVYVDGEDPAKPYALFLHGGPGFNSYAERNLLGTRFRSKVNLLWMDQLGCGEFRPASAQGVSWDCNIQDIAHVIRYFTEDGVHLLGHCLGTVITHDLIRLDRSLARSVIWCSPTLSLGEIFRLVLRRSLEEKRLTLSALSSAKAAEVNRFLALPDEALRKEDALFVLQIAGVIRDFDELYWIDRTAMRRYLAWMSEKPFVPEVFLTMTAQLFERGSPKIPNYDGIPVHMLYSNNDPVAPWSIHGAQLLQHIPHATASSIPGAGHWIQFENPEEYIRKTLEFLASRC